MGMMGVIAVALLEDAQNDLVSYWRKHKHMFTHAAAAHRETEQCVRFPGKRDPRNAPVEGKMETRLRVVCLCESVHRKILRH